MTTRRGSQIRHTLLAVVTLVAVAVAIDPRPFDGPADTPRAVAAGRLISPASATTMPPAPVTQPPGVSATAQLTTTTPPAVPVEPAVTPPSSLPEAPSPTSGPAPDSRPAMVTATTDSPSIVARLAVPVAGVFDGEGLAVPKQWVSAKTEFGTPRVLLTTELRGDWIRVLLPTRPNGSQGWMRARDLTLATVTDRIEVSVAGRSLTWIRDGRVMLQIPVAVGAPSSATPLGTFFVTDVLAEDPTGPYGSWLLALNGHSDALQTFDGGDARIAIHGTDAPSSIGGATSNGCVRVGAAPLAALAAAIAPGTPVFIN